MRILVLNGPNLNLLGKRNPEQYGSDDLESLNSWIQSSFPDHQFTFLQSNHEGELIDAIQNAETENFDGIVANFGGYTHTSVAIRDALEPVKLPKVEVHLSNIHAREKFREKSITGSVMNGIITGFGKHSYLLGIEAIQMLSKK
ncbi:MAG: type II 3-dehydroquinate dehydratase [Balneolaceae bacterium]